jgi:hypothetical protein
VIHNNDMPEQIVILSDMQFDSACGNTNFGYIQNLYKFHGYDCPRIVFWNLNGAYIDFPATKYDHVTLVSGFSPSLLNMFLTGTLQPFNVISNAICANRYDPVWDACKLIR